MKIEEILAVMHLSVEFQTSDGKKQVVKDVSLSLRQGEVLALVGESGCGKTVLCRSILKLLPKSASVTGEAIQYKDQNLIGYNEKKMQQIRGHGIAMVFQDPQSTLNPTMTVGSQIEEAILLHEKALNQKKREKDFEKNKKKSAKERAIELMKLVGIKDAEQRYDLYPYHFSGGMRQRAVMAIALAGNPKILFADEPTTALDVTIQAQILDVFRRIQKKLGMATVFISHDLGVVAGVADRVAVMYAGKIVEIGTAEEIFYDPRHPYTWGLLQSLPILSRGKEWLPTLPGMPPTLIHPTKGDAFAERNAYAMRIDYEKEPPMFQVTDTHYAATWLLDERAPKVKAPIGERRYGK